MSPTAVDYVQDTSTIHPALRSFALMRREVIVRLMAYCSGLAVLAAIVADLLAAAAPSGTEIVSPSLRGWAPASRPHPAFAVSHLDLVKKTESYDILRHPQGGRKDILRWSAGADEPPVAEIEIYRPGNELGAFAAAGADLGPRMGPAGHGEAQTAGVIDTKFGPVDLLRFSGTPVANQACLGFVKTFEVPKVRLSGWSCHASSASAQRIFLGCALNRLTLLSAGNDPKMAELFARAELRRSDCAAAAASTDWATGPQEPLLRGSI
ncbi:hypothetical protein [Bradyrhizobium sp. SYSU BS000235]|uniref:hypothetical protein n=1 Tax=Bradyrhizobium sp. SYSU BS000235 TaxID=3411332 RepID=UPI003C74F3E6